MTEKIVDTTWANLTPDEVVDAIAGCATVKPHTIEGVFRIERRLKNRTLENQDGEEYTKKAYFVQQLGNRFAVLLTNEDLSVGSTYKAANLGYWFFKDEKVDAWRCLPTDKTLENPADLSYAIRLYAEQGGRLPVAKCKDVEGTVLRLIDSFAVPNIYDGKYAKSDTKDLLFCTSGEGVVYLVAARQKDLELLEIDQFFIYRDTGETYKGHPVLEAVPCTLLTPPSSVSGTAPVNYDEIPF